MVYIVEVIGCEPHVCLILDDDGTPAAFNSTEGAKEYAEAFCAWEYRLVEF
jgi:hypothetical protein